MKPGGRHKVVEKVSTEELKTQLKNIFKSLKPFYFLLILTIIFAIFGAIFTIIGPSQLTKITDAIVEGFIYGIDISYVTKISAFLLTLYILSFVFSYVKDIIMSYVTQKYTKSLRKDITEKINKLPLKYFDKNETGDILSRVANDTDTISQTLNQSIGSLTSAVVLLIGVLIMMFKTSIPMTLTTIFSTIIGFILMIVIILYSQKYFIKGQEKLGELNGHIEEVYSSLTIVKAYNGQNIVKNKFNKLNESLNEATFKSQFFSGLMMPVVGFIGNFSYVSVCIVGSYLVMNETITFGVIVAYMVYVRLFASPLSSIAQAFSSLQATAAASRRVYNFLEEEEEKRGVIKKYLLSDKVKGEIEFKNVSFGYTKNKLIIKNFSSKFKPGSKIAIVGPTGSGKTTLVNLLMRFYDIKKGDILIDGININDLSRENVHDLFTMVLQDTWVFDGTIEENIIFNNQNATLEDVIRVTKEVGLYHLIQTMPEGFNTKLGDSELLSTGEKQLLTIARAMLDESPFLILDEATSNVDVRTEKKVQLATDKLMKNKTTFVIAHRLSTIKNADVILLLKDGNIIEQGTHDELLKVKGFYFELYNSQFEKI